MKFLVAIGVFASFLPCNLPAQDEFPPSESTTKVLVNYFDTLGPATVRDSGRFTHLFMSHPSLAGWVNNENPLILSTRIQGAAFDFDDDSDVWANRFEGSLTKGYISGEFILDSGLALYAELETTGIDTDELLTLTDGATSLLSDSDIDPGFSNLKLFGKRLIHRDDVYGHVSVIGGVKIPLESEKTLGSSGAVDVLLGVAASYNLWEGVFHGGISVTYPFEPDVFEEDIDTGVFVSAEAGYMSYIATDLYTYLYLRFAQSAFRESSVLEGYEIDAGLTLTYRAHEGYTLYAGYLRGLTDLGPENAVMVGTSYSFK